MGAFALVIFWSLFGLAFVFAVAMGAILTHRLFIYATSLLVPTLTLAVYTITCAGLLLILFALVLAA